MPFEHVRYGYGYILGVCVDFLSVKYGNRFISVFSIHVINYTYLIVVSRQLLSVRQKIKHILVSEFNFSR